MRKTQLWFSKESTPEYYNPRVTYDGRPSIIKPTKKHSTLGRSKRFTDYERDARKLGNEVGPGTYPQFYNCIYATRSKGTPIYKRFYRQRDLNDNFYYHINDSHFKISQLRTTF